MSLKTLLLFIGLLLNFTVSDAQNSTDRLEIEKVVKGYIENFFENNEKEMFLYLHPELAKRGISKKRGQSSLFFDIMDTNRLKSMLKHKKPLKKSNQQNFVKVLDVFENTASVKLETGYPNRLRWIEYIHLCKMEGQWLIANIIWDYYPKKEKS